VIASYLIKVSKDVFSIFMIHRKQKKLSPFWGAPSNGESLKFFRKYFLILIDYLPLVTAIHILLFCSLGKQKKIVSPLDSHLISTVAVQYWKHPVLTFRLITCFSCVYLLHQTVSGRPKTYLTSHSSLYWQCLSLVTHL
jgi:hypothetical protein